MSQHATKKFSLGRIVATPGALHALHEAGQSADEFLSRHVTGDWGELDQEDKSLNDAALIGRVDATFDRAVGALRVDGVWAERGAPAGAGPDVAGAVKELAVWLGATEVRVGRRAPRAWSGALRA